MEAEVYSLTAGPEHENTRIDKLVTDQESDWSRSQVQQWIKDGLVLVNDKAVKGNYKTRCGDQIRITVPEPEEVNVLPEAIELDVRYEDQDVIVVNKSRGMVVHPGPGHSSGTLVNALLHHCEDLSGINGELRPGIVHRIDMDTSGLIIVAKNDAAHQHLARQLSEKTVTRKYKAIAHGVVSHDKGTIDAPLGRDKNDRKKMTVTDENSRNAVTHFEVLERFQNYTYVECVLETGRTHQIRVHMKYIGHPLAGDPKYGPKKTLPIEGQALHAEVLGFIHPRTGEYVELQAELPEDMEKLLERLRKTS
ncbi:RluA family pseudouridine synthase [Bacillus marinisedimentorum]|uniref:RluA family pseudouridine synthase n=1 Tax=Bacillus marinisedimentorum TaxID=1821260 RepID=UPI0007DF17E0|nr:RluA family pseudouridine synthase [Bacillus marinisedimentorum]